MRTKRLHKHFLSLLLFSLVFLLNPVISNAQLDVYADSLVSNSTDFQEPKNAVDADHGNYAYVSNLLSILPNSYLRVRFPSNGKAGDAVNVIIQSSGVVLNTSVLNSATLTLYDSTGAQVATASGGNALQLSLLSPGSNIYAIRFITNVIDTFKFREARISFNNLLSVNLLNQFQVYDVLIQPACPAFYADVLSGAGPSTSPNLLQGYTTNGANAVDANVTNFATLNYPVNLLSLLPPPYIDLKFSTPGYAGNFVGFKISNGAALINLALLQQLKVEIYDQNNILRETKNNFSLLDLKLIAGSSNEYQLGFISQTGNYRISRLRLTLGGVLGLFSSINVYNAFQYTLNRPFVTVTPAGNVKVCVGNSVTLTAYDSLGNTNYVWSTGATTPSITVNQSGTYYVSVTDSFTCTRRSLPVVVTVVNPPTPVINGDSVLCPGAGGVLKTAIAYDTYAWSNGKTTARDTIESPGKYWVTVTNAPNCFGTDTINVIRQNLNVIPTITPTNCSNGSNGSITLNVTGGSGNYAYQWSTGATTNTVNNLKTGIYTVVVKDNAYSCSHNRAFTMTAASTLSVQNAIVNTSACGKTDGSAKATIVGGSGSYNYSWSNGGHTQTISNLAAGIYTLVATDSVTGCQLRDTVIVADGQSPLVVTASVTPANSCNLNNGVIGLSVTGGSGNYTYTWSNGAPNVPLVNGLAAGTYYILVKDNATQCATGITVVVTNSGQLVINGTVTPSSCSANTGSIALNVTNGSGLYSYSWSNGATTATISNLQTGTYIVTVTDLVKGCVSQKVFTVGQNGPAATLTVIQPQCSNNVNGSITVNASGPNSYFWSNGSTAKNQTSLAPGTYTLTITDTTTGCKSYYTATLMPVQQITLTAVAKVVTTCSPANGGITLTVNGATPPYTFAWSNGATTQNLSNIAAGTYTVSVSDNGGCSASLTVTVGSDTSLVLGLTAATITKAHCAGNPSGGVVVNVTHGTNPITYLWSNGATTKNLTNVIPGTYTLNASDAKGCMATLTVVIPIDSFNLVGLKLDSVINTTCASPNSGKIYVSTIGSGTPFTYAWSNAATTEDLINVPAGIYTLSVTDAYNCKASLTATINNTQMFTYTKTVTAPKCNGDANGAISINVTSGGGSYNYSWSTGQTTSGISNLAAGTYTVTINDLVTGCSKKDTTVLANPEPIVINATVTPDSCTPANTGSISLVVTGGKAPYTFSWSNAATTSFISDLAKGAYTVSVTDSNKCTKSLTINLTQLVCDPVIVIHNGITPNGDGVNDEWIIEGIDLYPNNEVKVFDKLGDLVFERRGYTNGNPWKGSLKGSSDKDVPNGTYYYILKLNEANKTGGDNTFTGYLMIQR